MKVLGIDPALQNVGWQSREFGKIPTYASSQLLGGGTIKDKNSKEFYVARILRSLEKLREAVDEQKPEAVGIESQLIYSRKGKTVLTAVFSCLVSPWHPFRVKETLFQGHHVPKYVVLISPERLQSLAHQERKTSGTAVVKKYRDCVSDGRRITEHEADAMFISYFTARFLELCVCSKQKNLLTREEKLAFHDSQNKKGESRAILQNEGEMWWENEC